MPDRRHVHLRIAIPDPGEWCDDGRGLEHCPILHKSYDRCAIYTKCSAGHAVEHSGYYRTRRPQSCRDAVIGGES